MQLREPGRPCAVRRPGQSHQPTPRARGRRVPVASRPLLSPRPPPWHLHINYTLRTVDRRREHPPTPWLCGWGQFRVGSGVPRQIRSADRAWTLLSCAMKSFAVASAGTPAAYAFLPGRLRHPASYAAMPGDEATNFGEAAPCSRRFFVRQSRAAGRCKERRPLRRSYFGELNNGASWRSSLSDRGHSQAKRRLTAASRSAERIPHVHRQSVTRQLHDPLRRGHGYGPPAHHGQITHLRTQPRHAL